MPNSNSKKELQSYLESTKVETIRLLCVLGSLLYLFFAVADFYSLSVTLSEVILIRGGVISIFVFVYFLSKKSFFIKYYEPIGIIIFLVSAGSIEALIYLSQPGEHASNVYFTGIVLLIMALLGWTYLSVVSITIVLVSIIVGYISISLAKGMLVSELMVNLLFFAGAITIGIASQSLRSRFLTEIFHLKESLAKALQEKTIESKNNAFLANHDVLTGLPNRRYVIELLDESLNIAKNQDKILSILFVDLNGFKQINDLHGHAIGDEVLKIVAKRLSFAVKREDSLSRLGGDEFLIGTLLDKKNLSDLDMIIRRYEEAISRPMRVFDKTLSVGASIGIASYPAQGDSIDSLMNIADEKMYETKHQKKQASGSINKLGAILTVVKN
jgi:diguanylate cyclase (GGDEF)-like protein